ncbi:DNA alkylation repair protein [Jeotgalibacillus proteolyticus]|uniref:DNA alkylation repair protein n=1 Tax=Jeotgalibacillus proteolyticus TaxID=2082395 RepID=A0A2S5GDK7_9BACL|nr:DNA alkylation repair protein [Jeotgalibacillus proteolyticus]PPA71038.1 DNA alkylation repair protein [Jeotgalibacillus proteolyticus]
MSLIKDVYTLDWIQRLGSRLGDPESFQQQVLSPEWNELSFKQRARHITVSMHPFLPENFSEAADWLEENAQDFSGLPGIVFPDYIDVYGQDHWDRSFRALKNLTAASTSEFAIRSFLLKDLKRCLAIMTRWAEDSNEHIRRLASEGARPRLPWGQAIPSLIQDPTPAFPILLKLLQDDSLYVRKSVANHLNDVSKTHPELILKLIRENKGEHPHTDWILRHASRTLLKKGHPEALSLFGFEGTDRVHVKEFKVSERVELGGELVFSFQLEVEALQKLRVDFAIDYIKKRGNRNRKVFKLSEGDVSAGRKSYARTLSFKDLTTRVHYPGHHTITLLVNGVEAASADFEVNGFS